MSRKRKAPVRKIYPDPKFHSEVISKFINSIMYDCKRSTAERILYNALDKIIGAASLANNLPLSQNILLLSGRISFELVQKSAVAGIPIIAAFGAPSSLAIELAEEMNISLVGFLKKDKFNIYSGKDRIQ